MQRKKCGPKGKVLEPFADEILAKYQQAKPLQFIVNWLSEPTRNVSISRQAVDQWIKRRLKKLERRATMIGTALDLFPMQVSESRQERKVHQSQFQALAETSYLGPPGQLQTVASPTPWNPSKPKIDVAEFLIDESIALRAQNPFGRYN